MIRNPKTGELEGFCIDLLNKLSDMMGFTYDVYIVEDGNYGTQVGNTWNGIIGDIIQRVSNMTVQLHIKTELMY